MIEIRSARAEDADALVEVYEAAWNAALAPAVGRELAELIPRDRVKDAFLDALTKTGDTARILVADFGDGVVGLAVVVALDDTTGELTHLYVHPDRWSRGIGMALHASGLREFQKMGVTALTLWVAEGNQRARRFYERAGWLLDDELRQSPLGPSEVRYTKSI